MDFTGERNDASSWTVPEVSPMQLSAMKIVPPPKKPVGALRKWATMSEAFRLHGDIFSDSSALPPTRRTAGRVLNQSVPCPLYFGRFGSECPYGSKCPLSHRFDTWLDSRVTLGIGRKRKFHEI